MKSIMVVDDSLTIRKQLRVLLEGGGYRVVEAENGQVGLERAARDSLDLIIVDVNMPVMGGIDMLVGLRKIPTHAATPIFVLTTESSRDVAKQGKEAGATAWIVKPFQPQVLLRGIQKVLER
jgi:two-component system chemotaxis response regulator CheY